MQVFPLREGRMVDRYSFHLENAAGEDLDEVLEQFCLEYYGSAPSIPPQILVPKGSGDTSALEEFLSERRGSRVEVRVPERGEKRRLQELAQQNAQLALESETFVAETKRARRVEALEELREALNLESLPIRIECFDISNIQGQEVVGSMVVFEDGVAKKGHYRKFAIRDVEGQDDFASMSEVISRRFSRLAADPGSEQWNESFAAAPNLVVIDGGKGQLSAALAAMHELDLPRVAVIALAKRIEEVFVPGRAEPIVLPGDSPGLQLLQRIRDEAHRFAITFHRQRRDALGQGVDVRPARGRRPGPAPGAAAALRLGRAGRRRLAGRARGRAGRPRQDGAADLRAAAPHRPRLATVGPGYFASDPCRATAGRIINSFARKLTRPGIRFHLPADAAERVSFAVLAGVRGGAQPARRRRPEAPSRFQHGWVRRARRLPMRPSPSDRRLQLRLARRRAGLPAAVARGRLRLVRGRAGSVAAARARCSSAFEFLRPLVGPRRRPRPGQARRPGGAGARRDASGATRGRPGARARCSSTIPRNCASDSFAVLSDYWEAAFAAEWARIEPQLADARRRGGPPDRRRRCLRDAAAARAPPARRPRARGVRPRPAAPPPRSRSPRTTS